ncbi:MAG: hypothetical protein Q9181_008391, partial [Wetmoreana brouardii]
MRLLPKRLYILLLTHSALSSITILMQLHQHPSSPHLQLPEAPPPSSSASLSIITQKCTSLPAGHCCVPIDLSETSHTTDRQAYLPVALDLRSSTPEDHNVFIWAGRSLDCAGPPLTRLELSPSIKWQKWAPKTGIKVTGFAIDVGAAGGGGGRGEEEKAVVYPREVTYMGGLYYEYMAGSLVYAKVSQPGEGPNIIYGMRQEGV